MSAPNVDLVLVIDASSSMRPCIDRLRQHLRELIKPLQGHVARLRFGLVALGASRADGATVYLVRTLVGGTESLRPMYQGGHQHEYFTDDPDRLLAALDAIEVSGNEHNLMALDVALDHPFGASATTKRVVALFSDEPLERGIEGDAGVSKLATVIDKIHARRVKLFCALPYSDAAQTLSEANGSEIEAVDGVEGLAGVDFRALLAQMGKSISVSALQGPLDEKRPQPLFGQDRWVVGDHAWSHADVA